MNNEGFLDVGSVSWSMLLACYFLSLHENTATYCITFDSIIEMLEVLKSEFGDYMPFECDHSLLNFSGPNDLQRFKESSFVEVIAGTDKDPL